MLTLFDLLLLKLLLYYKSYAYKKQIALLDVLSLCKIGFYFLLPRHVLRILKVDFHLSVWPQGRGRENDHVGMCSLIFCFPTGKFSYPFGLGKKLNRVQLNSRQLNRKL